ncbi:MAG: phage/plasmid primase, P4 family [Phycisphaeraceae bacterium]
MTAITSTTDHTNLDRFQLLDWLLPNCEPDRVALLYPKGKGGQFSPGWVMDRADAERAIAAYRAGTLENESFTSVTKRGARYRIAGAKRLGLVPHRNGRVLVFCVDLDDHGGDGGTVPLADAIARFFGAHPLTFTSKSGRGLHGFFRLAEPMDAKAFVHWARAWGFNRQDEPELFPKTVKNTQAWLPNEPNDAGGDKHVSGSYESCLVRKLPEPPSAKLSSATLNFLRGFVRQPGRNIALNKAAYELGQKRVPRSEAMRLCLHGARLCGLQHDEPDQTQTTFESGYDAGAQAAPPEESSALHEPEPTIAFRRLDGIGNGERFIDHHGKRVRYSDELDRWLVWTGKRWSMESQVTVEAMGKRTARLILREMERAMEQAEQSGQPSEEIEALEKSYRRHYLSTARVSGVRDMLKMAQSEPGVKVAIRQIDAQPMLLNVANGTIDLAKGTLQPHRRTDGLTKMAPVAFEPRAPCPRWDAFLRRIFERDHELIAYIQKAVGYSLTGDVGEQCLFFLYGTGQNGKSVFIQTLLHMLGEFGQKAPTEMLMKQDRTSGGGATPDMARLRGVRMAVTAELEENQRMGEARVKDLTGADRIVARPLYRDPIEFDPTHKLWIYGNHKPTIRGTDDGIWRRIRLIPFTVTIPAHEKDPQLTSKLLLERSGILRWAVEGCLAWQRDGLGLPAAVASATDAYRNESDRLAAFLDECCIVEQYARAGKTELYAGYEQWCRESGEYALSKKKLGQQLIERGFKEGRNKRERYWIGLGLADGGVGYA